VKLEIAPSARSNLVADDLVDFIDADRKTSRRVSSRSESGEQPARKPGAGFCISHRVDVSPSW
jgi:hypothetical protein